MPLARCRDVCAVVQERLRLRLEDERDTATHASEMITTELRKCGPLSTHLLLCLLCCM